MIARVLSGVVLWTMVSGFTAVEAAASSTHHTADRLRIEDCESCHQFPETRTHVTGVRPTFEIPAAYPLAPNGELTCLTCHEVKAGAANGGWNVRVGFLGEAFCRICPASRDEDGCRLAYAVRSGVEHIAWALKTVNRLPGS